MSTVYLATDLRLERDVALKVLHPHLVNDGNFLDRLGREAKAAARLSHPHVVGVLDQGNDGQTAYLVMEHIKGHTLRDVMNSKGALAPRLALALIDPVVEGLAAAHTAGLIHRDVKPENVLIADDGRIKIGDFGLARAVTTSTSTGALIGTVAYLSPELVLGKQADARSDIYSAGIMLYEMITGKQPFDGEVPIQVAYQHVNSTVTAPSAEVPGLATELDELVQWCTANDPENRPVDGDALLTELRHIRTNLTDAELDLRPPAALAAPQGIAAEQASAETVRARVLPPHQPRNEHTELIPAVQRPTEVISHTSNPTTVIPHATTQEPGRNHNQGQGYTGQQGPTSRPDTAGPLSKRTQRKLDREDEKARSKAAATPVRTLREGNSRRRGLLWVILLIIAALLATGAGWFFGMGPGSPGTVPPVANKTVAEAQQVLRTAGFQSSTKDVFDDDVTAGLVVGCEPGAGTEIRKFQQVALFVSKGPQLFPLPQLTGKSLDNAKSALNGAEMTLGSVTEKFDEAAAAGTVLVQEPAQGTPARHGTAVALTVSKGPQPVPVPDVRGQAQGDAVKAIEVAGLKAVIAPETVNDKKVPTGAVVSQSPQSGALIRGQSVTLTVSKGPKLVQVPSFIGKQASEGRKALEKLGFEVRVNNVLGGFFGTVRDQDPVDTLVAEGSVITLTVV
ncbi:Stk1 family PASTA domain-containing Ser/Thr kinase [Pseudarthrobacter sp. N5]|uniref:Stk1 family PASTA domain-containing Ser/Thr kinase n=1 Tax=Pseudarthrobacter sp. N5 TaxID=3418416 RepID=UPI003CF76CCB